MKVVRAFAIGIVCVIFWYSCFNHDVNDFKTRGPEAAQLNLRWIKGYSSETKEDIMKGLMWNLSFLGAMLDGNSLEKGVTWIDEEHLLLDVSKLGFSTEAQNAFKKLFVILKNSEEYRLAGSCDLGRFIALTLNSTNHYYAITGAKVSYSDFRRGYQFAEKKAAVLVSSIARGNRIIEVSQANSALDVAFIAMEGDGLIEDNSFKVLEFECMDLMPNGQLRFALYDSRGSLKTSASPALTEAGKPAKCLWCHEIHLIPPFDDNHTLPNFYSTEEFKQKLIEQRILIDVYRDKLDSPIDFQNAADHTKGELIYLSFMEPSAERLAMEWGVSVQTAIQKLNGLEPHAHQEFSFLGGSLYYRKDVDALSPYNQIGVPEDAREHSVFEPDFIN